MGLNAMIMAAGLGTRMMPFSQKWPKPFLPLLGVPSVQYHLDLLELFGVSNAVLNVHHLFQEAEAQVKKLESSSLKIQISDESKLLLGSAGGIAKALPLLGEAPFLMLNGDVLVDIELSQLWLHHQKLHKEFGCELTMVLTENEESGLETYREIFQDSSTGRVVGLGDLTRGKPFYLGVAIASPALFRHLPLDRPTDFVKEILRPNIERGKVGFLLGKYKFFDIGNPKVWARSHFGLAEYSDLSGVNSAWSKRIKSQITCIAPGVWIQKSSEFSSSSGVVGAWKPPVYFAGSLESKKEVLGPDLVWYGAHRLGDPCDHAICYSGLSATLKD